MKTGCLLERLHGVKKAGAEYRAICPAHEDEKPSLSIREKSGKILIHCHAGCTTDAICSALGIRQSDLFIDSQPTKRRLVATYDYTDEDGNLLYQKLRYDPKDFRIRIPDGKGGWVYKMNGQAPVLYNLAAFKDASMLFVCEGEKDVETLRQYGYVGTTNFDGAGKWRPEYNRHFAGRMVFVLPDNDAPGRRHATKVYRSLAGIAEHLRIVQLPNLPDGGDVSDWFNNGGTVEEFNRICLAAPEGIPAGWLDEPATTTGGTLPLIRLSSVKPEPVSWLWNNRFPNKGLNLIAGMGEVGKTTFASYLMSRLTTGRDWFDCENTTAPGTCLFIGDEDDLGCAIRPKLDAAGADVNRIVALDYESFLKTGGSFNLVEHIDRLEKTIETLGDVRAIFFDPLNGYLGQINAYSDSETRGVLIPLQNIAKKYDLAVFGLCHLNKKTDLSAVDRVLGSVAFVNTARSVWFITWDKETDTRYLTKEKSNYSVNPTNLSFRIIDGAVAFLEGTTDKTADDVLRGGIQKADSTNECIEWLKKKLAWNSVLSSEISAEARHIGFSEHALRTAKRTLNVQSKKDGYGGKWMLSLPETEDIPL